MVDWLIDRLADNWHGRNGMVNDWSVINEPTKKIFERLKRSEQHMQQGPRKIEQKCAKMCQNVRIFYKRIPFAHESSSRRTTMDNGNGYAEIPPVLAGQKKTQKSHILSFSGRTRENKRPSVISGEVRLWLCGWLLRQSQAQNINNENCRERRKMRQKAKCSEHGNVFFNTNQRHEAK